MAKDKDLIEALETINKQNANLEKLMNAFQLSISRYDKLQASITALTTQMGNLVKEIGELKVKSITNNPSTAEIARIVQESIIESESLKGKSLRAVIEKFEEQDNDNSTSEADKSFVEDMAKNIGIDPEEMELEKTHRYGQVKNGKPRVIKVQFRSKAARDKFLYGFRKNMPSTVPKKVLIRRDMTKAELDKLYSVRKEAWQKNQDCGLYKYFVSDLSIKEIANPKALNQSG